MRSLALAGACIAGTLLLAGTPAPVPAAATQTAKSFTIAALQTEATVHADGSMTVREEVTYSFAGGPFTIGVRSFDDDQRDRIDDVAVSADGEALAVDPPFATPTGEWEWHFAEPVSDQERTFVITYEVADAVTVGPDVGELYWQFVGDDHPGIGDVTVDVELPGAATNASGGTPADDASVIRAWAHGPADGVIVLGAQSVSARVRDVPARTFVELRILVPASDFDVAPRGEPRLGDVLDEEGGFIDGSGFGPAPAHRRPARTFARWMAPIMAALGLGAAGLLGRKYGREPRSSEVLGEYWREPLDDPPAVVIATLKRGNMQVPQAIAGTLIDLAQRDVIRITAATEERLGPDRAVHTFHWMGTPLDDTVRPFERELLEMVFRGQTETDESALRSWARGHQREATAKLSAWQKLVKQEYRSRGYDAPMTGRPALMLVGVCAAMALAGIIAKALGTNLGWVTIGAAVVAGGVGFTMLANRTQRGAEAAAKAEGLERFLTYFSQLDKAPIGHLILWERFLVYAVTLGVSAALLRNLSVHLPQVVNDPSFATFYAGPHGRLDGLGSFGAVGTTISTSFSPPSKSGSGGGFSGGGGGGGGGGGFGAR